MWGDSRRKPAPRMQKGRELRTAVALPEASGKCTSLWRIVEGGTATCELRCLIGYSGCRLPWTTRLDKDPRDTATWLRGTLSLQAISGLTGELWKVGTLPPQPPPGSLPKSGLSGESQLFSTLDLSPAVLSEPSACQKTVFLGASPEVDCEGFCSIPGHAKLLTWESFCSHPPTPWRVNLASNIEMRRCWKLI